MPPSVLLREDSTQILSSSINFSKLEDSFLYFSTPKRAEGGGTGGRGDTLYPPRAPVHQTLFPSTIAQKYPSPARNRSRLQQPQGPPQPMSGPYGGKKKTPTAETTGRSPTAYWGSAAGGFLSWATTGYQQPPPPPHLRKGESGSSGPKQSQAGSGTANGAGTLSVNWNDRSVIFPNDGDSVLDYSTSAGALQLLGTIKRLSNTPPSSPPLPPDRDSPDEENERLEAQVEKLQKERSKDEALKQQMKEFKREYQERISLIQKKLLAKKTDAPSTSTEDLTSVVDSEKVDQLEKTVHGLLEKVNKVSIGLSLLSLMIRSADRREQEEGGHDPALQGLCSACLLITPPSFSKPAELPKNYKELRVGHDYSHLFTRLLLPLQDPLLPSRPQPSLIQTSLPSIWPP
jgi:hypothetical protein